MDAFLYSSILYIWNALFLFSLLLLIKIDSNFKNVPKDIDWSSEVGWIEKMSKSQLKKGKKIELKQIKYKSKRKLILQNLKRL